MIVLAYRSTARQPELALVMLADILAVSQSRNAERAVTGALLVSRGRFFQILEGNAVDVAAVLGRIEVDGRHRDIEVVMRREAKARLFEGWSMVAARVSPSIEPEIDQVIDNAALDPEGAVVVVRRLVERQRQG